MGSSFYYVADDGIHGDEVWRTDGAPAGTFLLKDVCPGACASNPRALTGSNGLLFFFADDLQQGPGLWQSDGTPEGTSLVKGDLDGRYDLNRYLIPAMADAGGSLLFVVLSPDGVLELWVTDGTQAGTHAVGDAARGFYSTPRFLAAGNGQVLFAAQDSAGREPWVTDGTNAGTHRVADLSPGAGSSLASGRNAVAAPWGGFVFMADDGTHGPEVWWTDGTVVSQLKDIAPGSSGSSPFGFTAVNGKVVFAATDPTHGSEIWVTDGTAAGTVLLQDVWPGGSSSDPREITAVGSQAFFRAADGTAAGTSLVKDLAAGYAGSFPDQLRAVNGRLAFASLGHLGLSDGTEAGTGIVPGSFVGFAPKAVNNELYFFSRPGSAPAGLWKTDGTEAGTVLLVTHDPSTFGNGPVPVPSGGKIFYTLFNGSGFDLWVSDGTAPGTSIIGPGLHAADMTDAGGTLFFRAFQPALGVSLWKSDGTAAGTVPVGGGVSVYFGPLAVLPGGILLFEGDDGTHGQELWRSDGTDAGTVLVKDIRPGLAGAKIYNLTATGNQAFFVADDGIHVLELWVSDGTAAGTHLVKNVVPGAGSSYPSNLTAVGSVLVFSAFDAAYGVEPWRSDGTDAGTWRLADVAPGPLSSSPLSYTLSGKNLFFVADDNTTGFELWAIPKIAVVPTFADVPSNYWAWRFVEALAASGVTGGCGGGRFCPGDFVNRAQMAVFVLTARDSAPPPAATGTRFADVPANYWAARFIEQLAADGITGGCGGGNYCPDRPITRGEMAVFLATAFQLPQP